MEQENSGIQKPCEGEKIRCSMIFKNNIMNRLPQGSLFCIYSISLLSYFPMIFRNVKKLVMENSISLH
jgi:hypothetical protein